MSQTSTLTLTSKPTYKKLLLKNTPYDEGYFYFATEVHRELILGFYTKVHAEEDK